ncbi:relaxin receptor 2-like [Pollicipes pollicipes]|uniref:relaxin receptor 2-like n=1 Tax=Pollicipes pollicipes TaxID=41117 RepID=UPI0018856614|nr:relaxin receptor 2-like [Pollicipes pollicipes]
MACGRLLLVAALLAVAGAREAHVPMPPNGECPANTVYICIVDQEAKYCTYRAFLCDGKEHCENGEDEDGEGCIRKKQNTAQYSPKIYDNFTMDGTRDDCSLKSYPSVCRCSYRTRLECSNRNLTRVPSNVSPDVTRLYLQDNRIVLRDKDLNKYTQIQMVNLNRNELEEIPQNFFSGQDKLFRLLLRGNRLRRLQVGVLAGLANLAHVLLDGNLLTEFAAGHFQHLPQLRFLNLSRNRISLENYEFPPSRLQKLHLENNIIRRISSTTFRNLRHVKTLYLQGNRIDRIADDAFHGLAELEELYLNNNRLTVLGRAWFTSLHRLTVLHIGFNQFTQLPVDGFYDLKALYSLDLSGLNIENITEDMWAPLQGLDAIKFSRFSYCAYTPRVSFCEPRSDGVSSEHHLLDTTAHKAMIWLIALMTIAGNLVVLWGRGFRRADDNKNVSVLICNLAVADLLMGIYLLVIASKDVQFRGEYNLHALAWMRSPLCVICGVLAMTSSEVAVMIMTFMSVDRFLAIVYPMVRQRASGHMSRTVLSCMSVIWTAGLTLALVPVFYWQSSSTFYGLNGICFPLHIQEPYIVGWKYSAFVFLVINVASLLLILCSYMAMFCNIQQTRRNTPLVVREVEVALRFFCIVTTDCLCWTPIMVVKAVALAGVHVPVELHAWIAVFVLPINSAVNPFLYTFTTTKFYSRMKTATARYSICVQHRRESVNVTGSESVGFTQRTSLHVMPVNKAFSEAPTSSHRTALPNEALLTSHATVTDSKC